MSLVWFENVRRFWEMEPIQFNYSLLSRSKQITHENLRIRDAALVDDVEAWWNARVAKRMASEAVKNGLAGSGGWITPLPRGMTTLFPWFPMNTRRPLGSLGLIG